MKMKKGLLTMLALLSIGSSAFAQTEPIEGKINVPYVVRANESKTGNQVIVFEKEKTGTIQIELKNSEGYRDLQFDLTLPDGVSLATGENEEILAKSAISTHVMGYGPNTNRFVLYSESGAPMPETILLKIPVKVASVNSLEGVTATLSGIFTSDDDAKSISLAQTTFPFRVMLLGDVNDNNVVNLTDAVNILYASPQFNSRPSFFVEEVADVNGDTKLSLPDAVGALYIGWGVDPSTSAKKYVVEDELESVLDPE